MERLNFSAKALHVGLNPEPDLLGFPSRLCKLLDVTLAELPEHVMQRLQQNRGKAISAVRCQSLQGTETGRQNKIHR